jgi:hypothetical protein
MKPPVEDFLYTVAEVAVAFAGFAGLVTVLTQRLGESQREFDIVRFRDMLLLSLIAGAFALFPTLPASFGASEPTTWRVSSALFVAAWAAFALQGLLAGFRLSRSGARPFSRPLFWSNLAVHAAAMIALLFVVIDAEFVADVRSALYLAAIFAMLYLAGAYFLALFMTLARE